MRIGKYIRPQEATAIPEPKIATFLFADTRLARLSSSRPPMPLVTPSKPITRCTER